MSGLRFSGLLRGAGYGRSLYVEWEERGERTTLIDDDALRHAKGRIWGHLLVTQMAHWEAERAMFCSTDLQRVVACSSLTNI